MDKKKTFNEKDFEYTIVMDASYLSPAAREAKKAEDSADMAPNADYELLYYDYERMIFRDPTVLDKDDAYPHSYQWRMGDRYDPAKIEVLKAALSEGKRITDTEAYQEFIEDIKSRKLEPLSWE